MGHSLPTIVLAPGNDSGLLLYNAKMPGERKCSRFFLDSLEVENCEFPFGFQRSVHVHRVQADTKHRLLQTVLLDPSNSDL